MKRGEGKEVNSQWRNLVNITPARWSRSMSTAISHVDSRYLLIWCDENNSTALWSLDCKEIKPVNPKRNQLWILIGRTDAESLGQYFGHLMQGVDSLVKALMLGKIEGKRRKGWQRMRWLDSLTDSMNMNLSKLWEIEEDRGAWHASVHGIRHDLATEQQQQQICSLPLSLIMRRTSNKPPKYPTQHSSNLSASLNTRKF